jgi:hypothetical protein
MKSLSEIIKRGDDYWFECLTDIQESRSEVLNAPAALGLSKDVLAADDFVLDMTTREGHAIAIQDLEWRLTVTGQDRGKVEKVREYLEGKEGWSEKHQPAGGHC